MSAAVENFRNDVEATYAVDSSRDREPMKARARFPEYRRRGSAPSSAGGMHCRRSKRWTWGSGRGARTLNMRAFAGAIAFVVASVASSVLGVTIDMRTIGNPGNAANSANGFGAVPYVYQIGTNEVTNTEYAAFLNAVGGSNPFGIYNANMGSDSVNGGIVQNGIVGSFTYAVKGGFESKPVNYTSWYSAARFVNWLHNGQTNNPASLENGSYRMPPVPSGPMLTRTTVATYVIPTANEWFKAAFHTGGLSSSSYTTYGTDSNTVPTPTGSSSAVPNTANFNLALAAVLPVGSFSNSASAYGLYDTMGNVVEMTETVDPNNTGRFYRMSGAFNTASVVLSTNFSSSATTFHFVGTANQRPDSGFRIAAVPEPSTYALLAAGVAGLGGLRWMKRRRQIAA